MNSHPMSNALYKYDYVVLFPMNTFCNFSLAMEKQLRIFLMR